MIRLLLPLLFLIPAACLVGQNKTFPPVNDLAGDSSLTRFVSLLKTASANKDIPFVVSQLDKEVASGFDGENGTKAFIQNWGLMEDSTKFWAYLSRALETGGAMVNDPEDETGRYKVVFPYVYNFEPDLEDDYYALGVITGKNVNLRDRPDTRSAVKTQLTYDVIWFLYPEENNETQAGLNSHGDPEWYLIETYNRKFRGWVNWKYVYSTTGPRLFLFKNQLGKWKISAFVQGD